MIFGFYSYNAAAHLRRAHFHPRPRGRRNKGDEKRGGKGGGDHPAMDYLRRHWMSEITISEDTYQSRSSDTNEDEINLAGTRDTLDSHSTDVLVAAANNDLMQGMYDYKSSYSVPTALEMDNLYSTDFINDGALLDPQQQMLMFNMSNLDMQR
jgi:hypothetical protein